MDYREFYNVYAHIPTDKEVQRKENEILFKNSKEKRYTGVIQVELKTRTPLFTPDTSGRQSEKGAEAKHKEEKFFSYDGKTPVIPGSSLRGVLRNIHEVVTNSCFAVVNLEDKPIKRTSETYKPGILQREANGDIHLYEAKKAIVKYSKRPDLKKDGKQDSFKEGAIVKFTLPNEQKMNMSRNGGGNFRGNSNRKFNLDDNVVRDIELPNSNQVSNSKKTWRTGYYFKGEPGVKKLGESENAYVFYFEKEGYRGKAVLSKLKKGESEAETSREIQGLLDVLASYDKNKDNVDFDVMQGEYQSVYRGYKEYSEQLQKFFDGKLTPNNGKSYFPVHYSQVAGNVYLSPACITKEVSYTSIMDILEAQGKHHTCTDFSNLCPTCRLFGMVGMEKNIGNKQLDKKYSNAWASSIRVQDAVLKEEQNENFTKKIYAKKVTLMELASPKKSSAEFYLQKPQGKDGEKVLSWTYDYYLGCENNNSNRMSKPKVKATLKSYTPKLAGRKFYWHHQVPNLPEVEPNIRNCTVTPVNSGVEFEFPIYFEKITKKELDQLIWICNISHEQEKGKAKYGYKVGKGKPLGLGSVEFHVTEVKIRSLKDGKGNISYNLRDYRDEFSMDYIDLKYDEIGLDLDVKEALLRICDFRKTEGTPITYPVANRQSVKKTEEGFRWFMYNRYNINTNNKGEPKGNGSLTKRDEMLYQQYAKSLKEKSQILYVNKYERNGTGEELSKTTAGIATDQLKSKNSSNNSSDNRSHNINNNNNSNNSNNSGKNRSNNQKGKYRSNKK